MDVALQEVNVREERESLYSDERVAETAPPFSDVQDVKLQEEMVRVGEGEEVVEEVEELSMEAMEEKSEM